VHYVRVPLTHGVAPRPRDFDAFYSSAAAAGPNDALIYTCQLVSCFLPGAKSMRTACDVLLCVLICLSW
jgi:hypothetical protein